MPMSKPMTYPIAYQQLKAPQNLAMYRKTGEVRASSNEVMAISCVHYPSERTTSTYARLVRHTAVSQVTAAIVTLLGHSAVEQKLLSTWLRACEPIHFLQITPST